VEEVAYLKEVSGNRDAVMVVSYYSAQKIICWFLA